MQGGEESSRMADATTTAMAFYFDDIIGAEDVLAVVEYESRTTAPFFPYKTCERFILDKLINDEAWTEFHFHSHDTQDS